MWIIAIVAMMLVLLYKFTKNEPYKPQRKQEERIEPTVISETKPTPKYSSAYQKRYLLTKNEWYEYKKLKRYAAELNLQICPKVRLLDLVEPIGGEGYMSYLGKIQSKHVDFVLCDQDLRIKAILELDDNSHNQQDRKERDLFVDEVLQSVGYRVIRTRSITETTLEPLKPFRPTEPTEPISQ